MLLLKLGDLLRVTDAARNDAVNQRTSEGAVLVDVLLEAVLQAPDVYKRQLQLCLAFKRKHRPICRISRWGGAVYDCTISVKEYHLSLIHISASGEMPKEKQAGKMISPAQTATKVSSTQIRAASPGRVKRRSM